jgi:aspartate-semialdehyde dehydrogenase
MKVGIVGWRGMVGSVLMDRMRTEQDLKDHDVSFYSTSNAGAEVDLLFSGSSQLQDAFDIEHLKTQDVILTCQGGSYTERVFPQIRKEGWSGYWIDAASTLRMDKKAIIALDPINRSIIDDSIHKGVKTFVGGNCTVSLMLMALGGLFQKGHVKWLSSMTYQAASGAGAANMKELVAQAGYVQQQIDTSEAALNMESEVNRLINGEGFPKDAFGYPLAYSLLPFIDKEVEAGQSREEWKGFVETNKILQSNETIPIDGICVRIGALRCHSQAFTIALNDDIPMDEIKGMVSNHNEWVQWVDNNKEATLSDLTPASVSGTLKVPVGRVRKMRMGGNMLSAFSVGDQLLWGAAEPLRRMLMIINEHKFF